MPLWEIVRARGRVFSPFGRALSPFGQAFSPQKNGFGINISEEILVCPNRSFLCKTYLLSKRQKLSTFWRGRYDLILNIRHSVVPLAVNSNPDPVWQERVKYRLLRLRLFSLPPKEWRPARNLSCKPQARNRLQCICWIDGMIGVFCRNCEPISYDKLRSFRLFSRYLKLDGSFNCVWTRVDSLYM